MKNTLLALTTFITACLASNAADDSVSLAGSWRFQLDRADTGMRERWFTRALSDRVTLPGSLTAQGIGDEVSPSTPWIGGVKQSPWFTAPEYAQYREPGNVKPPFWLTPEKYYAGAAWYQRDVEIPAAWAGKRIVLSLERPHWETRVWVGSRLVGTNDSLAVPHEYDLGVVGQASSLPESGRQDARPTAWLAPGKHTLTIRVDNRMVLDIGENSHSVSDHTQGNWNGVVGNLELRATPRVWIEDMQVYPNAARKLALVKVRIGSGSGKAGSGQLVMDAALKSKIRNPKSEGNSKSEIRKDVSWNANGGLVEAELALGEGAQPWDEFNPALYELTATLIADHVSRSTFHTTFGLREIATRGTQFTLNGRKTFIRGTLDCCIYPKTGHPPTDVDSWKRVINVCKAHGLNLIRFHSWCPPEAAFVAADELGFYFHVEAPSWANQSTTLGDGKPVDAWIYAETDRILKYYGNHPSFILMPYGNEPGGKKHAEYLAKWVSHYRTQDARRLWTSGAGWPQIPENQFHVTPDPRIQGWGEGLKSRINAKPPETTTDYRDYIRKRTVPVISHEIGQWCVYPNFDEIPKYTGYLKPKNFEVFRDSLNEHQMGDLARQFLLASGKLQTLCYKEDIESALRTPGMGGFELLDLHDFPGQGTALVGVLDPFWEGKGYVTPQEYSRFCNVTVPLARLGKRVFTTDERLEAELEIAHFGARPLENAVTDWKLADESGKVHASGRLPAKTLPVDNGIALGKVSTELKSLPAPAKYRLVVSLMEQASSNNRQGKRSTYENDWDVWVYPSSSSATDATIPAGILVTEDLDDAALARLNAGGKVLLTIPPKRVRNAAKEPVLLGFSSIFWNTAWTSRQAPTTLGILCDPKHQLFAEFPTEFHSNWQWWYLIHRAGAMILDDLPSALRPTVQVIDDWVTNRKLGLVFEAKVGAGKLVVCSIDLERDLDADPVRRQFRHSLLRYMSGAEFNPTQSVNADQVRALMAKPSAAQKLGILNIQSDSEEAQNEAENAMDGDPQTLWHTPWRYGPTGFPHYLQIECKSPKRLRGFAMLPRQDGNRNGWICDYAFYASDDGKNWGEPVKRGTFAATKDLKTVLFDEPVSGRFFMFVALSGFAGQYASLAELSLLEETPQGSPAQPSPLTPLPSDGRRGQRTDTSSSRNSRSTNPALTTSKETANDSPSPIGWERVGVRVRTITVDGCSPGLVFDGVGAVSAGGSSRLLMDYPERERKQILDYLFKPNYGAALQILKVEIGADTDATCGAEPSHQRTPGHIQCDLGYEWWLMQEAKARNPKIKLCGLAWGAPGWIGQSPTAHGSVSRSTSATSGALRLPEPRAAFWSDDNIRYTMAWLDCVRQNGLHMDYLGGGNERGWDANYCIKLRQALNDHGYAHIKLIATDDHSPPHYWAVAGEMKTNRAFADAVDILGQHDVCVWRTQQRHCYVSADAAALDKPLWDSENSTQDYATGCEPLARAMNRHYIEGRITANLNWSLVGAYYGTFPAPGTGLLLVDRPWSGWYGVGKSVWVDAHTTQFAQPGWRYLDSACGYTGGGASYVTLRTPDNLLLQVQQKVAADYALVIEAMDLAAPETVEIRVTGGLSRNRVHVWQTNLRSDRDEDHFRKVRTIKPVNGAFQITLEPGHLYTLSTTSGQRKGNAHPKAKSGELLPLPFRENFERCGGDRLAKYFADVHGAFEAAPCGGGRPGMCYRQMIAQEPILWHGAKMPPTTIVGDPRWWGDYEVGVDALLEGPGYVVLLGRVEAQQHNAAGYHFQISDTGDWTLSTQGELDRSIYAEIEPSQSRTLASGTNSPFGLNTWHRLALRFRGNEIAALLDGRAVATVRDDSHTTGQTGLRASAWQHAQFDNFSVAQTAPWPEFIPHSEMTAIATSEHSENDFGSVHLARNAIDDRVETSWRSRYVPPAPLPQSITIDLKRARTVYGLTYKPELAGVERGTITGYSVYLSADGQSFEKVAGGNWSGSIATKMAAWPQRPARYVRLKATAVLGDMRHGAAAAEIEVATTPFKHLDAEVVASSNVPER